MITAFCLVNINLRFHLGFQMPIRSTENAYLVYTLTPTQ
jgi:hypothetical protein